MAVLSVVRDYLVAGGFDGLVSRHADCGCSSGTLAPCGEIKGDCSAAARVPCDRSCGDAMCEGHYVAALEKTQDEKAKDAVHAVEVLLMTLAADPCLSESGTDSRLRGLAFSAAEYELGRDWVRRHAVDIIKSIPAWRPFIGLIGCAVFAIFTGCGPMAEDAGGPVDSGHVVSVDAGYTEDGGIEEPEGDAGPCQAWRDQWCEQGCVGTIGIEPGCGELGCCDD